MTEFEKCPLCGGKKLILMRGYEESTLTKCNDCTFVFCKNIPTDVQLQKYYSLYPSFHSVSTLTILRYNQLLDELEKYRMNNNIIDIGCGEGFFLEQAVKRGWKAFGTEYAEQYVEVCKRKNIKMKQGKFNPSDYPSDYFDVVASIEVLEHINYPYGEIENFNKVLRSGGIVYLTTPNFNSLSRRILKGNWNVICFPEHLSYFTSRSIRKLFLSCGFHCLKMKTTGISIDRMKEGLMKRAKKEINEVCISHSTGDQILRDEIEKNILFRTVKRVINYLLTLTGTGDTLKVYFLKR